jgi:hypothetical protein
LALTVKAGVWQDYLRRANVVALLTDIAKLLRIEELVSLPITWSAQISTDAIRL